MDIAAIVMVLFLTLIAGLPLLALLLPRDRRSSLPFALFLVMASLTIVGYFNWLYFEMSCGSADLSARIIFLAILPSVALGSALAVVWRFRSPTVAMLATSFLAAWIVMNFTDFTPVKPYVRFYAAIRPGITETDLLTLLNEQFPQPGRYAVPAYRRVGNQVFFNLDLTDGRYDAEVVSVDLQDNRVVAKAFQPD